MTKSAWRTDRATPAATVSSAVNLSNGGETLTLVDPYGAIIQQFVYDDAWYPTTDGDGYSLEFRDPTLPNLDAWNQAANWAASGLINGTPGGQPVQPGDANLDGVFDTSDLVLALKAGEYEDAIADNSTWSEGDWNGDGDFNTADLVAAFAAGNYVDTGAPIAATKPLQRALEAAAVESVFGKQHDDLFA